MVAILEKSEHNVDFHPIVDFIEASLLRYALTVKPTVYVSRIRQFWSTARIEITEEGTKILATVDGILRTVTETSLMRNLKLHDDEGISRIVPLFDTMLVPQGEGSGTPTEPHDTPSPEAHPTSNTTYSLPTLPPVTTASIPTVTLSETTPIRQYTQRARIAQSSALPLIADELTTPLRDVSKEVREGVDAERSGDDAPIKGRNLDEGEAVAKRVSDDTKEMATVLTSMDAATVLASGVADVPTASPPAAEVPTGSDVVPTAGLIFATATVVTPYIRRKGKETLIAKDEEIARIHAEEELQSMIDGLDMSNEIVAKYLQENQQFALELPQERRIELISDLVRIVPLFDTMLVPQGKGSGTPTEPHDTPSPEAHPTSNTTYSLPTLPPVTTASIPTVTLSETTPIRQYTQRARIAQSSALPLIADELTTPLRDVSKGEACPIDSGF
nr:hypothetical protein [Tanacetum cinerariifolium]